MTSERRFEQDLPELLAELAPVRRPDYRDDIVRQTAPMRQRPAWMFPERWLPVSAISTRAFAAPPTWWRLVGLVALLLLALAVGLAFVAGSQRHVVPPFGPAGNGLIAYEANGNIYTADQVTGATRAVVAGADTDLRPVFSRDGTHIVFERRGVGSSPSRLVVTRADGSGPVVVTPEALYGNPDYYGGMTPTYSFSPDGKDIVLWTSVEAGGELWIAHADGSGMQRVDLPMTVIEASWLPPDGAELIVTGSTNSGSNGVFAVDPKTGAQRRTIVAPQPGVGLDYVRLSPDGSRLAYVSGVDQDHWRVHVVGVDGSNDVTLPLPARAVFQDAPAWSNDGTRLAITRGYAQHNEDMALAVVPPDGSGTGIESAHRLTGCCDTDLEWSPDDSSILVMPDTNLDGVNPRLLLLDPSTGATTPAPWTATTPPDWQRIAR